MKRNVFCLQVEVVTTAATSQADFLEKVAPEVVEVQPEVVVQVEEVAVVVQVEVAAVVQVEEVVEEEEVTEGGAAMAVAVAVEAEIEEAVAMVPV